MASKEQRLKDLKASFKRLVSKPTISGTVDEFYSRDETYSGLWIQAEGGNLLDDGMDAFNYHYYAGGINKKAQKWADDNNVLLEFHDAGTLMMYLQ